MHSIAILGGTFDPIHFGHLRPALELTQQGFDEVRLMPCHVPAHREAPDCSAEQRLAMVELAVRNEPALTVDVRELEREGDTFTVDTLLEMRQELGEEVSLNLVMGMDSFVGLHRWHCWEKLIDLANIIVTERPGQMLPTEGVMARFLKARQVSSSEQLQQASSGRVLVQQLALLDISATRIRALIKAGQSARFLLPETVWDYIEQHRLYRS
ncbi:Nicotinate-nucleotide adenylyltransferase [gamma proteobacterium IMCC2047]|nr:Nicotinate-nucleotide adenylyltransferase [gamma proteobacterium IMCC2047]